MIITLKWNNCAEFQIYVQVIQQLLTHEAISLSCKKKNPNTSARRVYYDAEGYEVEPAQLQWQLQAPCPC